MNNNSQNKKWKLLAIILIVLLSLSIANFVISDDTTNTDSDSDNNNDNSKENSNSDSSDTSDSDNSNGNSDSDSESSSNSDSDDSSSDDNSDTSTNSEENLDNKEEDNENSNKDSNTNDEESNNENSDENTKEEKPQEENTNEEYNAEIDEETNVIENDEEYDAEIDEEKTEESNNDDTSNTQEENITENNDNEPINNEETENTTQENNNENSSQTTNSQNKTITPQDNESINNSQENINESKEEEENTDEEYDAEIDEETNVENTTEEYEAEIDEKQEIIKIDEEYNIEIENSTNVVKLNETPSSILQDAVWMTNSIWKDLNLENSSEDERKYKIELFKAILENINRNSNTLNISNESIKLENITHNRTENQTTNINLTDNITINNSKIINLSNNYNLTNISIKDINLSIENITFTNESFYWTRYITNEYSSTAQAVMVQIELPLELKEITQEIDKKEIKNSQLTKEEKQQIKELRDKIKDKTNNNYKKAKLKPDSELIKDIEFENINIENDSIKLGIKDLNRSEFLQSYAIDPTKLNFTEAKVTVTAKGEKLYKCKDWNFSEEKCFGEWKLIKENLIPGEEYTFTLTPQDPAFGEVVSTCSAKEYSTTLSSFSDTCDDPTGSYLENDDTNIETHNFGKAGGPNPRYGGVQIQSVNSSINDCINLEKVELCYKWWQSNANANHVCEIRISNNSGSSFTTVSSTCPTTTEPSTISCIDITSQLGWSCENFFGTSTTRAVANSEIWRSGGGGPSTETVYLDVLYFNATYEKDYPPNISIISPENKTYNISKILVNISTTDDISIDTIWYNWNGTNTTYTQPINITFNEGYNTLNAWVNDSFGNINQTQINFTIDTSVPAITNIKLNATSIFNLTTDNLTCNYNISDKNFTTSNINWIVNNKKLMILNTPFEGNSSNALKDFSGLDNSLTNNGATWNSNSGYNSQGAFYFPGNGEELEDSDAENYINGLKEVTVSVWVKADTIGTDRPIWDTEDPDGDDGVLGLRYDVSGANSGCTNCIKAGISTDITGSNVIQIESSSNTQTTNWQHIVLRWQGNGNPLELFLDGEKDTGASTSGNAQGIISEATKLIIGDGSKGGTNSWLGYIDDFRIYNKSLSEEQIRAIYNNKTDTITSQETNINDKWQCEVTAFNSTESSNKYTSNEITISSNSSINVEILSPENTTYNYNNILIDINYSGNDIYGVWYEWNSTTIEYNESIYTLFNEGTNTLNAWINDSEGYAKYTNVTFTIDSKPPSVDIISPTSGSNYEIGQTIDILANVTDNNSIMSVIARIKTPTSQEDIILYDNNSNNIYNSSYEITYLGINNITIIARDTFNNVNNSEMNWINITYSSGSAIYCQTSPCIANENLIVSRDSIGGTQEPNQPNTIDSCTDGTSGDYMADESIDSITIRSLNGTEFRAGDTIEVNITAYCYDDTSNNINFIYANDSTNLEWKVINSIDPCPASGFNNLSTQFILENSIGIHAIRGAIQYNGATTSTCGTGSYDDNDDLEILVKKAREYDNPKVTIISPKSNNTYYYNNIVPIQINITDQNELEETYVIIKKGIKEWRVNLTDYDLDNIYEGEFSQTNLIGNYSIQVYAKDMFQNINNTQKTWFMINDTGTLKVESQGCYPNIVELNNTVICSVKVEDVNVNISTVLANITIPNSTIKELNPIQNVTNNSLYYIEFNETSNVGYYEINWWANNTNKISRTDIDFFSAKEHNKPSVKLLTPISESEYNSSETINISANVTDDTKIDSVIARITKPDLTEIEIELNISSNITYYKIFQDTMQIGNYYVTIIANDTSGNINNSETTWFNVQFVAQGAIYCEESPCIANESLIISRDNIGGTQEPNQPNTIDSCTDGTSGTYMTDESIDSITIKSLNGTDFRVGDTVEVNITAYCYDDTNNNINFVYANNSQNIEWKVIHSIDPCPAAGFNNLSTQFVLDNNDGIHAFRATIQYQGDTTSTCGTGEYDDNDDIEFKVLPPPSSNIIINPINTNLGNILPNTIKEILNSLNIKNIGELNPQSGLNVTFNTSIGSIHGLLSNTNIINASNFKLNNTQLNTNGTKIELIDNQSLVPGFNKNISATLNVPPNQPAGEYNGTILISWIS